MLADFHIHSTFSDGSLTIPQIVDHYGKRGFGAIAITDHLCEENTLIGRVTTRLDWTLTRATWPIYIAILKSEAARAKEQYGMVLIPGVELTKNTITNARSAHILALGITDEYISADLDIKPLLTKIRSTGALTIAAHPVSTRKIEKQTFHLWDNRLELASLFDAWEVASGPYLFSEVHQARLPVVASSDLHRLSQMTSWKTVLRCQRNPEDVLDSIRTQNLDFLFYEDPYGAHNPISHLPHSLALSSSS